MSEAHNLSVVLFAPEAIRDIVNACLAAYGYGEGNLSVELERGDGSKWYGCHAWTQQEFLDQLANPPADIEGSAEAIEQVIMSSSEGGDGYDHWMTALEENDLSIPYVDVNA